MSIFSDVNQIMRDLSTLRMTQRTQLDKIIAELQTTNRLLARLAEALAPEAVGIKIEPGIPTSHSMKENDMVSVARMTKAEFAKKHGAGKSLAPGKPHDVASFILLDNQDDTCTVVGVSAAGNPVDISAIASLTPAPSSDNAGVLTVDPPSGMTFAMHAVGPVGTANVMATATWNDGSKGPFSFTLPVSVQAGGATGIKIVPGTPTVRT